MASIIKLKRSLSQGAVPGTLQEGEIAVNLEDKKLFVGGKNGGSNTQVLSGDLYNLTSTNGPDNVTITLTVDNDTLSNDAITIAAGEGIDVSESDGTITVSSEDATTTNKGVASFNTNDFSVSSGAVSIKSGGVTSSQIADKTIVAGDIADGTITATQLAGGAITANTIDINSVALGTKTTGNYVATVTAGGSGLTVSGSGSETAGVTVSIDDNISANTSGNAATASQLATARTIAIAGDQSGSASFDGSGNIIINTTTQNNSVDLGTHTTGNYASAVTGTANEIEVTGAAGEGTSFQIGLPNDVTIGNDLIVSGDAGVVGNVTIDGNLTVEGATTYVSSSTVNVDDSAVKLSANNSGDVVDQGMYGMYIESGVAKYAGWHRDASDSGIIKWYSGLTTEPTTTVDSSHTSYSLAQMDAIIDGGTY